MSAPEFGSLQTAAASGAPNIEPPCPECGAASNAQGSRHAFLNRVRSLFNIDADQLPELDGPDWHLFRDNPVRFFMRANDTQADAIWREVERLYTPDREAAVARIRNLIEANGVGAAEAIADYFEGTKK